MKPFYFYKHKDDDEIIFKVYDFAETKFDEEGFPLYDNTIIGNNEGKNITAYYLKEQLLDDDCFIVEDENKRSLRKKENFLRNYVKTEDEGGDFNNN